MSGAITGASSRGRPWAFTDGYEAVTGKEYRPSKPLTTKAQMRSELQGFEERLAKSLESYVEEYGNQQPEEEG
jgi:hypothetical protein